ncbi:MAG: ArgE/DapE family deacylase [Candidatus Micrarchaeota archaeon]|nr:ArgE/DapE family deacylase [Candidatus Micrarchaeota archaeon]
MRNKDNVEKSINEVTTLLSDMVRIESVNNGSAIEARRADFANLMKAAEFVEGWLIQRGFEAKIERIGEGELTPVVTAEAGHGKKTLVLNGHIDVVPIGNAEWKYGPFSGKIIDGKVYGRGTADMKGGVAIHMQLFSELADKLDYKIVFNAVTDEESGGFQGSRNLAPRYKGADLALIAEPGGNSAIGIGEKGVMPVNMVTYGKSAHASRPSLGKNAITIMANRLDALSKIGDRKFEFPEDIRKVNEESDKLFGNEIGIVTFNLAKINGGIKTNMVPNECTAVADMRVPVGLSLNQAFSIAKELFGGTGIEMQRINAEPNYTKPTNTYVKEFEKIVRREAGDATLIVKPGGSDGRFFRDEGIPTIVYGPGEYELIHTENEYVSIKNLEVAYKVYREFMLHFGEIG